MSFHDHNVVESLRGRQYGTFAHVAELFTYYHCSSHLPRLMRHAAVTPRGMHRTVSVAAVDAIRPGGATLPANAGARRSRPLRTVRPATHEHLTIVGRHGARGSGALPVARPENCAVLALGVDHIEPARACRARLFVASGRASLAFNRCHVGADPFVTRPGARKQCDDNHHQSGNSASHVHSVAHQLGGRPSTSRGSRHGAQGEPATPSQRACGVHAGRVAETPAAAGGRMMELLDALVPLVCWIVGIALLVSR